MVSHQQSFYTYVTLWEGWYELHLAGYRAGEHCNLSKLLACSACKDGKRCTEISGPRIQISRANTAPAIVQLRNSTMEMTSGQVADGGQTLGIEYDTLLVFRLSFSSPFCGQVSDG